MRILKYSGGFVKLSAIDAIEKVKYSNGDNIVRLYLNGGEHINLKVSNFNFVGDRKIEKIMEMIMSYENKGSNVIIWEEL